MRRSLNGEGTHPAGVVDHDHETMKNRELLCSGCNLTIGFIEKNNLDINKIKNYINKHKINTNGVPSHPEPI